MTVGNRKNELEFLRILVETLAKHGAFPVFGTILGIVRDGGIIDGDDDVDFYVEASKVETVEHDLVAHPNLTVSRGISSKHFRNYLIVYESQSFQLDLYLIQRFRGRIIDKWNSLGLASLPITWLIMDEEMFFPLATYPLQLTAETHLPVPCPNRLTEYLEFTYGEHWQVPQRKGVDYKSITLLGRPLFLRGWRLKGFNYLQAFTSNVASLFRKTQSRAKLIQVKNVTTGKYG